MKAIAALSVCAGLLLASFAYAAEPEPPMKDAPPDADVVAAFIAAINQHDVAALAELMTEDHSFIDSSGRRISGRKETAEAWKAYFALFPDFEIRVETTLNDNGTCALFGAVSGTFNGKRGLVPSNRIAMPAAWKAMVSGGKIGLWQVYCDWTEGARTIEEDRNSS